MTVKVGFCHNYDDNYMSYVLNFAIQNNELYIGSAGKENVYNGKITDYNMNWVKKGMGRWLTFLQKLLSKVKLIGPSKVTKSGQVSHEDWSDKYAKVREAAGCSYPGYLWHESRDPTFYTKF